MCYAWLVPRRCSASFPPLLSCGTYIWPFPGQALEGIETCLLYPPELSTGGVRYPSPTPVITWMGMLLPKVGHATWGGYPRVTKIATSGSYPRVTKFWRRVGGRFSDNSFPAAISRSTLPCKRTWPLFSTLVWWVQLARSPCPLTSFNYIKLNQKCLLRKQYHTTPFVFIV